MTDEPSLETLGALVLARREALRLGRRKAAAAGEMSPTTWEKIEKGGTVYGMTYSGVETVLGWPQGSIRHYLETGEPPTEVQADEGEAPDEGPPIRRATHDQLLDELRRRHDAMRDELGRVLYPELRAADATETAESVRARGNIPGRPMDTGENDGAAEGVP